MTIFSSRLWLLCAGLFAAIPVTALALPPLPGNSGGGGSGIATVLSLGENISFHFAVAGSAAVRAEWVLIDAAGLAEKSAALKKKLQNIENSSDPVEKATVTGEVMSETDKLSEEAGDTLVKKEKLDDAEKEKIRKADRLHFWAGLNIVAIGVDIAAASIQVTNAILHANPIAEAMNIKKLKRIDSTFKMVEVRRKAFEASKKRNDNLMKQIYDKHHMDPPETASVKATDSEPQL